MHFETCHQFFNIVEFCKYMRTHYLESKYIKYGVTITILYGLNCKIPYFYCFKIVKIGYT